VVAKQRLLELERLVGDEDIALGLGDRLLQCDLELEHAAQRKADRRLRETSQRGLRAEHKLLGRRSVGNK